MKNKLLSKITFKNEKTDSVIIVTMMLLALILQKICHLSLDNIISISWQEMIHYSIIVPFIIEGCRFFILNAFNTSSDKIKKLIVIFTALFISQLYLDKGAIVFISSLILNVSCGFCTYKYKEMIAALSGQLVFQTVNILYVTGNTNDVLIYISIAILLLTEIVLLRNKKNKKKA